MLKPEKFIPSFRGLRGASIFLTITQTEKTKHGKEGTFNGGLPSLRPGFYFRVGFVVDKVALGQVSLRVRRFSPVSFTVPVPRHLEK
jgi:hypothetical protein